MATVERIPEQADIELKHIAVGGIELPLFPDDITVLADKPQFWQAAKQGDMNFVRLLDICRAPREDLDLAGLLFAARKQLIELAKLSKISVVPHIWGLWHHEDGPDNMDAASRLYFNAKYQVRWGGVPSSHFLVAQVRAIEPIATPIGDDPMDILNSLHKHTSTYNGPKVFTDMGSEQAMYGRPTQTEQAPSYWFTDLDLI